MRLYVVTLGQIFFESAKRFYLGGFMYRAAALAYAMLLSLVPLLTITFTLLTAFPAFQGVADNIKSFLFNHFVATSAEQIQNYLQTFVNRASNSSPIQILTVLAVAIILVFNIEMAFNDAWRVRRSRNLTQAFLLYWAVLTLTPVLVGAGFAISSYVMSTTVVAKASGTLPIQHWLFSLAPYGLSFIAFSLLYLIVPNCNVPLRFAVFGGIIATVLFELAKWGFAYYITHFPRYSVIYGALASVVVFLVWMYLSWLIILYGAICSRVAYEKSAMFEKHK